MSKKPTAKRRVKKKEPAVEEEFGFEGDDNQFSNEENEAPDNDEKIELPHTLQLTNSVKVGKKTYTQLVFQNPLTVRMMKHLPAGGDGVVIKVGHSIPMVAGMTGVPSVVIEALSAKDFMTAVTVVRHFM